MRPALFDLRFLATCLLLVASARPIYADGGVVLLSAVTGARRITLFASPAPLRVGAEDFSVLLQVVGSESPVLSAQVRLSLEGPDGTRDSILLTRAAATNKLLYAGSVSLAVAGDWRVRLDAKDGGTEVETEGVLSVQPPEPPLRTRWPLFAVVPLAIGLFALHQWLQAQREGQRNSGSRTR